MIHFPNEGQFPNTYTCAHTGHLSKNKLNPKRASSREQTKLPLEVDHTKVKTWVLRLVLSRIVPVFIWFLLSLSLMESSEAARHEKQGKPRVPQSSPGPYRFAKSQSSQNSKVLSTFLSVSSLRGASPKRPGIVAEEPTPLWRPQWPSC